MIKELIKIGNRLDAMGLYEIVELGTEDSPGKAIRVR